MNEAYDILKRLTNEASLCVIRLNGENVIGEFLRDEYGSYSGYMFRSSICPQFVKHDNEIHGGDATGYACEVMALSNDGDDLLVSFEEEAATYHRVYEIIAFNKNCRDATSPRFKADIE